MKALITGVSGQVGSYLAEYLLEKGYEVHGLDRRKAVPNYRNIEQFKDKIQIIEGDITDAHCMNHIIQAGQYDEIYNLAAQSVHPKTYIACRFDLKTEQGTVVMTMDELWNKYPNVPIEIVRSKAETGEEIEVEVKNLKTKRISTIGYKNGFGYWMPLEQISRHRYKGCLCNLQQKWGEILVTPNHSIYDSNFKLCSPTTNPDLLPVRKLNHEFRWKQEVLLPLVEECVEYGGRIYTEDSLGRRSKISVKRLLQTSDGSLQAFCRFIGAFIAEGHTTISKTNKGNCYYVCISNNDKKWLEQLQQDVFKFCDASSCFVTHKKALYDNTFRFEINSKVLFLIIRELCGLESRTKCFPDFFFDLSPECQLEAQKTLYDGDGSVEKRQNFENERYSSTSPKLAAQLVLFNLCHKRDFIYGRYEFKNEKWNDKYEVRNVNAYDWSLHKKYTEVPYEGYVYDISVENVHNFCIMSGGVVVHNSHVGTSFNEPNATFEIDAVGVTNILEAIRHYSKMTRLYQASTSELFGCSKPPQNEETPLMPQSPYGCAKLAAHHMVRIYSQAYGIKAACGIMFNTESPRRGDNFVTKKITNWGREWIRMLKSPEPWKIAPLVLGNLDAKRDWSHCKDSVDAIYRIIYQDSYNKTWDGVWKPYTFGSGVANSVRDFLKIILSKIEKTYPQIKFEFEGAGLDEKVIAILGDTSFSVVKVSKEFYRPAEVDYLLCDPTKIKTELGWQPKFNLEALVNDMLEN